MFLLKFSMQRLKNRIVILDKSKKIKIKNCRILYNFFERAIGFMFCFKKKPNPILFVMPSENRFRNKLHMVFVFFRIEVFFVMRI